MNESNYLTLLILGLLVVVVDGQILYQSGKRYLANYGRGESGKSLVRLVVVLFHLVVLGVLALISTIDIGGTGLEAIVTRLGVVLLLVAVAHGAAIGLFARIRENEQVERPIPGVPNPERQTLYDPVVAPVSPRQGPPPEVSQGIESGGPYSTSQ